VDDPATARSASYIRLSAGMNSPEANVPHDRLFDLDEINDQFDHVDAVLVIGANDVVNPGAHRPWLAHLRDADPERGQRPQRDRAQAQHGGGLQRHGERAVLQPQDRDALRRREEGSIEKRVAEVKAL
jgi:hypothetical protein